MKPWMKFLVWFGLGTGLGIAIGEQIGYRKAKYEDEPIVNDAYEQGRQDAFHVEPTEIYPNDKDKYIEAIKAIRKMYGATGHEEVYVDPPQPATDDDPEMPMEEPVVPEPENEGVHVESRTEKYPECSITYGVIKGPENEIAGTRANGNPVDEYAGEEFHSGDIPQFHPTFEIPRIVTEEEYDSRGDLEEKVLIYYEGDEVLYCVEDQKPIGEDEQPCLIGIGTLEGFRVGPGAPKDELFVINETYGRFKIYRMDDAFTDAVDGNCAPEDDDEDVSDDFWDNGDV